MDRGEGNQGGSESGVWIGGRGESESGCMNAWLNNKRAVCLYVVNLKMWRLATQRCNSVHLNTTDLRNISGFSGRTNIGARRKSRGTKQDNKGEQFKARGGQVTQVNRYTLCLGRARIREAPAGR